MQLDKQDLLTLIVLSTVFFSLAVFNLGMTKTPTTTWQTTENTSFVIDFGDTKNINKVYFLVKFGSANVTVYTGSSENWNSNGQFEIPRKRIYYYRWSSLEINRATQYVRFDLQSTSIEIAELAVLSMDNQTVTVDIINDEVADPNLSKLVDEQSLVQCPPTFLSQTYFDEIYFVQTAENYLNLQSPYSWSHPPLGKLIIASGIAVFGYNPFGWRIMGVIFSTLSISLIYLAAKELFGTWIGAFSSAFLYMFSFMTFTMGRIGTVDVYVAFFSLTSQLFFLIYIKRVLKDGWKTSLVPLFLAVLFFAFGFSTKWIVMFGFLGQLAILLFLRLREVINLKEDLASKIDLFLSRPFFWLIGFLVLAVCIYFLTYVPSMIAGRSFTDVFELQFSMFSYHAFLESTHPFASRWWTWPFIVRPLWMFLAQLPGDFKSTIVAMGNPAVWWVGFSFVILSVKQAIQRKDFVCIFISVMFFSQWLPYVLISRTTYLYHFFVCVPFLCLATAYFVSKYWNTTLGKAVVLAYFAVVVILFGLFYPVLSGMSVSISWVDSLKWFESWVF